jgi:hypothetical protein
MDWWGRYMSSGLTGNQSALPLLPGYTIYFPDYDPNKPSHRATLMHELAHIYQKDNYISGDWGDAGATIKDAIVRAGGTESWEYNYKDLAKKPFSKFARDQQAQIIADYYEISSRDTDKKLKPLEPWEKAKLNVIIIRLKEAELLK